MGHPPVADDLTVEYMTRILREHSHLSRYSLGQVAQGIWFLIGEASPAQLSRLVVEPNLPFEKRMDCIEAMVDFFRGFVAEAAPGPSRHEEDPFHIACYMWWDIFPCWGKSEPYAPGLYYSCLSVMEEILGIPSELCQFSALHGLNHWHLHHAEEVERIVASFLASEPPPAERVRAYALQAIRGRAQ